MIKYENLESLLLQCGSLDKFGTLFVNREQWEKDPIGTPILLLVGDDELEDVDEDGSPFLAVENDVRYFFDVELFQSVVELQIEKKPDSVVGDFVFAINYYLENDDFYEPN